MNMCQLFNKLPRDIQWEILTEFVGSHAVRNGKLMKRIVFDERHQMLQKIPLIRMPKNRYPREVADMFPNSYVEFSNGTQLFFTTHPEYGIGLQGYLFISNTIRSDIPSMKLREEYWVSQNRWYCDGDAPFEKHSYPSYPDTEKKKKNRSPFKFY